jgi:hypothetical protein
MSPTRYGQFIKLDYDNGTHLWMLYAAHDTDKNFTLVLRTRDEQKAITVMEAYKAIGYREAEP